MKVDCIHCGPKEACLFAPSEMKKARPICRACRKARKSPKLGRKPVMSGREHWNLTNRLHFLRQA